MDPTRRGANAMRLAPDYDPPTRPRRDGSHGRADPGGDMPTGPVDAGAGGAGMPDGGAIPDATMREMPRGEMQADAPAVRNRLVGMMEDEAGANQMPNGAMPNGAMPNGAMPDDATVPTGTMTSASGAMGAMPMGAMTGGTHAANATGPGADGMPEGTMRDQQDGAKPGETTPNRATLEGAVGGLTLRGEWRFTLSSVSTGSGG